MRRTWTQKCYTILDELKFYCVNAVSSRIGPGGQSREYGDIYVLRTFTDTRPERTTHSHTASVSAIPDSTCTFSHNAFGFRMWNVRCHLVSYIIFLTLFRFDANDAADAMQIAKPENCERFSNLFIYIENWDVPHNLWTNSCARKSVKIGQTVQTVATWNGKSSVDCGEWLVKVCWPKILHGEQIIAHEMQLITMFHFWTYLGPLCYVTMEHSVPANSYKLEYVSQVERLLGQDVHSLLVAVGMVRID